MVRSWYGDIEVASDCLNLAKSMDTKRLYELTGVEYFKIDPLNFRADGKLDRIRDERGYTYEDEFCYSPECSSGKKEELEKFFQEHLHPDEEIRFVLEGEAFFDFRDANDKWIHVVAVPGDMVVVPAGIYHRATLDLQNAFKAKRYFISNSKWLSYNRPADSMDCRKLYLEKLAKGFFT